MLRLLVHVEGESEEEFANELLGGHLIPFGYESVSGRLLGSSRQRSRRGGIRPWSSVKGDILRHLAGDAGAVATLLVDFYALPEDWPGKKATAQQPPTSQKAEQIETSLLNDLIQTAGRRFNPRRFVPFVVMHEFEGLLFSDPLAFAQAIRKPGLGPQFAAIRSQFETPEDINDSAHTAPSKRILSLYPKYQKTLQGKQAAKEIGLETIRSQCPHFHNWLTWLENLPEELSYVG